MKVPGESLKLKQLKALVEEQAPVIFSGYTSKREATTFLKRKVRLLANQEFLLLNLLYVTSELYYTLLYDESGFRLSGLLRSQFSTIEL